MTFSIVARDGDAFGVAVASRFLARSLIALSWVVRYQRDRSEGESLLKDWIETARACGDLWTLGFSLDTRANVSLRTDLDEAIDYWRQAMHVGTKVGERFGMSISSTNLAWALLNKDRIDESREMFEEGLRIARELGFEEVRGFALAGLGFVELRKGRPAEAEEFFLDGLIVLAQGTYNQAFLESAGDIMTALAGTAAAAQNHERAARLAGVSKTLHASTDIPVLSFERWVEEELISVSTATLGEEQWRNAFQEGCDLSIDEIVPLALHRG